MLSEYTRAKSTDEVLRASKHGLHGCHCMALAMSGLLRDALGVPEMELEHKARGGAVADVSARDGEVSVMFPSSCATRPAWSSEDESQYLRMDYEDFVWLELQEAYSEGLWSPYDMGARDNVEVLPSVPYRAHATMDGFE